MKGKQWPVAIGGKSLVSRSTAVKWLFAPTGILRILTRILPNSLRAFMKDGRKDWLDEPAESWEFTDIVPHVVHLLKGNKIRYASIKLSDSSRQFSLWQRGNNCTNIGGMSKQLGLKIRTQFRIMKDLYKVSRKQIGWISFEIFSKKHF